MIEFLGNYWWIFGIATILSYAIGIIGAFSSVKKFSFNRMGISMAVYSVAILLSSVTVAGFIIAAIKYFSV